MEEARKVGSTQERLVGFELVLGMVENYIEEKWGTRGIGVPASVNTYTSARVFAELVWPYFQQAQTATEQDFPTFVYNIKEKDLQKKIDFILEDLFTQKIANLRSYSRAGRPSPLAPLRRLARRDWLSYTDFVQNYKQDYITKQTKEENLLFVSDENEENIRQIIKIFLSGLTKTRKRRRDAEKGREERRRQAQLFPVHATPPESSERNRKEDRADE